MPFEIQERGEDKLLLVDTQDPDKKLTLDKKLVAPATWERATKLKEISSKQQPEVDKKDAVPPQVFQNLLPSLAQRQEEMKAPAAEQGLMPQFSVQQALQAQPQIPMAPVAPTTLQATTTQRQETIMGKEQKKAFEAFTQAQQEVAKTSVEQAKLEVEKQKELGIAQQEIAEQNLQNWADVELRRMDRDEQIEKQKAKLIGAMEEYKNFQFKDFFEDRNGARVLAGISVALGAVGSAFTKGPNFALQIIDSAIQNDLALQKASFEKTKGKVEMEQNIFTKLLASGLDEYQADKAAYAIRAQQGIEQIEAMKSQVSDPQAKVRLDNLQAQLKEQIAAKQLEATKGLDVKVVTETKPVALPSAEDRAKALTAFQEAVAKTPAVKEAIDAESGLREWKAGAKSAVDVARFIAGPTGLGQGSYGETFNKMLNDAGLIDRTVQGIETFFGGGQKEQLIKNIENFLRTRSIESAARAKDYLEPLERVAVQNGFPQDILRKQMSPVGLAREKAKALGLTPVRKP